LPGIGETPGMHGLGAAGISGASSLTQPNFQFEVPRPSSTDLLASKMQRPEFTQNVSSSTKPSINSPKPSAESNSIIESILKNSSHFKVV